MTAEDRQRALQWIEDQEAAHRGQSELIAGFRWAGGKDYVEPEIFSILRAALEQTKWMPIETAPKDGKILGSDGYDVFICRWVCVGSNTMGWANEDFWYLSESFIKYRPTHWMPLPAAPDKESE